MSPPSHMLRLAARYPRHVTALVLVATVLVVVEAMGLGTVFLVLGAGGGATAWLDALNLSQWSDMVQGLSATRRVQLAALVLIAVALVRNAMAIGQNMIALNLRLSVARRTQARVLESLHRLPLDYLQRQRGGYWNTCLVQYGRELGALAEAGAMAVVGVLTAIAYLVFSLLVSWQLALLAVVPLTLLMLLLRPVVRTRLHRANQRMQARLRELNGIGQEQVGMIRSIRAFGREQWSREQFDVAQSGFFEADRRVGGLVALNRPLFEMFSVTAFAMIVLVGSLVVGASDPSGLAQIALFIVVSLRLLGPAAMITHFLAQSARIGPVVELLAGLFWDAQRLAPPSGRAIVNGLNDAIVLEGVRMRYASGDAAALEDLDLRIPRGQTTALVGPSGAGKSSVANLVLRLYDPEVGAVRVDGRDLRDIDA
ncbi:MAG: ABC transporter ATP-binding protein, partial [Burkholderiaceae bacterium]